MGAGENLVWTPDLGVTGTGVDAFTVQAWDGTTNSVTTVHVLIDVT